MLFFSYCSSFAQLAINSESADFENNKLSPKNYFGQELEVVAFSFTKAWFTSAVPKKLWNFEIFLIGNASVVSENQNNFHLHRVKDMTNPFIIFSAIPELRNGLGVKLNLAEFKINLKYRKTELIHYPQA